MISEILRQFENQGVSYNDGDFFKILPGIIFSFFFFFGGGSHYVDPPCLKLSDSVSATQELRLRLYT